MSKIFERHCTPRNFNHCFTYLTTLTNSGNHLLHHPYKRLQDFITFNTILLSLLFSSFSSSSYYYYNSPNFPLFSRNIVTLAICAGKFVEYNRFLSLFLIKCISNSFVEFANPSGFCWCFWPTNYCK